MTLTAPAPSAGSPAPNKPRSGRRGSALLGWASLVLVGATVGLGLVLPKTAEQAEYSRLIAVHPPVAWVSYVAVGIAALAAVAYLVTRRAGWDRLMIASLEVGVVFTALTLATGSIWSRPTWGVWWRWEPRLTTEALLLAVLVGAVALRRALPPGRGRAVVTSVFSLATLGLLPIVHFSVELWRSQHQRGTLLSPDPSSNADNPYLAAMFLGFLAFTVLYAWMVVLRVRIEALEEASEEIELRRAIADRRSEGPSGPSERDTQGPSGPSERETQGPSGPSERDPQGGSADAAAGVA